MTFKQSMLIVLAMALVFFIGYSVYMSHHKKELAKEQELLTTFIKNSNTPYEIAVFAGGCFWPMEEVFEKVNGVLRVESGYTGGHTKNPTYKEVGSQTTGHLESVEVLYNPHQLTYEDLLQVYWRSIDPTDAEGQFADRGSEYRTAVFYSSKEQKELAEASRDELAASKRFKQPIVTKIAAASTFYKAETEHQDYYKKNPLLHGLTELASGRDAFLNSAWGKDREVKLHAKIGFNQAFDKEQKLKTLTKHQFNVTQRDFEDPPFENEYWANEANGIYVDIVSGEPLFSSQDQFDAGSGWPSFTKPLESNNIVLKPDPGLFSSSTQVRSRYADSFLGHVFDDGPKPTGLRYCINSSSMIFIPAAELDESGYGDYAALFAKETLPSES